MRAGYQIVDWGGEPVWRILPDLEPRADEVLIEVEACGIGMTVLNSIRGDGGRDRSSLPRVPGHEIVGRVIGVGAGVDSTRIGQRIVAYFYLFCGECDYCKNNQQPLCRDSGGLVGVNTDGGYGSHLTLPSRNAVSIPDSISPVDATVIPDAVATPVHIAERAELTSDDEILIIGAGGGVGIHLVQVCLETGARVRGLDRGGQKSALISRFGAEALDARHAKEGEFGNPDVVVDLVGATSTLEMAMRVVRPAGRVVLLTTFRDTTVSVSPREIVFREMSILGSRYASVAQVEKAAELIARGAIEPVIGSITGPTGVLEVHDLIENGKLMGRGAIDWNQPMPTA